MPQSCPSLYSSAAASPHCCSRLGYSYVPCHRAPLPSSDTSSAQLLYSRRPLHLLPLLVPHHSSSSSTASVLVVYSTLCSFAISLSRLARAPGPAFLSPGNCSNFDPRDTTRPVGMWTLHTYAPVSLTRESRDNWICRHWALLYLNLLLLGEIRISLQILCSNSYLYDDNLQKRSLE